MIRQSLNIISCITTLLLTSCTGQVSSEQALGKIINDSLTDKTATKTTDQIKSAAVSNDRLTRIYSLAISDYITEVSKQHLITFDTLFFGKRNNGQPDDFPDIVLPDIIKNCQIRLIDPEVGKKLQEEKKSRVYINLIGWVNKDKAEFFFVTFSNGFEHKFDFHINYKYNLERNEFELAKSRIEIYSKK
jgi:hypothetical protein